MIHDLGNKGEMVHEIFEMKPFKVICEPLVLTLAYVGMIGPLATPYTLHPGPKGDEVRHINIRLHFFFPLPCIFSIHIFSGLHLLCNAFGRPYGHPRLGCIALLRQTLQTCQQKGFYNIKGTTT